MPEHGGRIALAARRFGIPVADWLDLSTGISPHGYPVVAPPASSWSRLPEPEDGLCQMAADYYGTPSLLPVAGSQAAIMALPRLREACRVGVLTPSFSEHARAWAAAGHAVEGLSADAMEQSLDALDVLVVGNPNNPCGRRFPRRDLLRWHAALAERGGWLVVDEAFADAHPQDSLARHADEPGLIVLRSVGKFFGLAGARVGFVLAAAPLLAALDHLLGPWTVAGPSRVAAATALADAAWQEQARRRLGVDSARLADLLGRHRLAPEAVTALFAWCPHPRAESIYQALARRGVLARRFHEPPGLRFGLPGAEQAWARLEKALEETADELEL